MDALDLTREFGTQRSHLSGELRTHGFQLSRELRVHGFQLGRELGAHGLESVAEAAHLRLDLADVRSDMSPVRLQSSDPGLRVRSFISHVDPLEYCNHKITRYSLKVAMSVRKSAVFDTLW